MSTEPSDKLPPTAETPRRVTPAPHVVRPETAPAEREERTMARMMRRWLPIVLSMGGVTGAITGGSSLQKQAVQSDHVIQLEKSRDEIAGRLDRLEHEQADFKLQFSPRLAVVENQLSNIAQTVTRIEAKLDDGPSRAPRRYPREAPPMRRPPLFEEP